MWLWTARRQKGRKERGNWNDALEGKNPGEYWRGGGRRGPEPSRTGTNITLNIGTESRVQIADALGKELKNHPKMSKLWDSETGPTTTTTTIFSNTDIC